jgi:hypothetical protein
VSGYWRCFESAIAIEDDIGGLSAPSGDYPAESDRFSASVAAEGFQRTAHQEAAVSGSVVPLISVPRVDYE